MGYVTIRRGETAVEESARALDALRVAAVRQQPLSRIWTASGGREYRRPATRGNRCP